MTTIALILSLSKVKILTGPLTMRTLKYHPEGNNCQVNNFIAKIHYPGSDGFCSFAEKRAKSNNIRQSFRFQPPFALRRPYAAGP